MHPAGIKMICSVLHSYQIVAGKNAKSALDVGINIQGLFQQLRNIAQAFGVFNAFIKLKVLITA